MPEHTRRLGSAPTINAACAHINSKQLVHRRRLFGSGTLIWSELAARNTRLRICAALALPHLAVIRVVIVRQRVNENPPDETSDRIQRLVPVLDHADTEHSQRPDGIKVLLVTGVRAIWLGVPPVPARNLSQRSPKYRDTEGVRQDDVTR